MKPKNKRKRVLSIIKFWLLLIFNGILAIAIERVSQCGFGSKLWQHFIFDARKANLLTLILLMLIQLLLIGFSKRLLFSVVFTQSIILVFSVVNAIKNLVRSEQLLPSDLVFLKQAGNLLSLIPLWLSILVVMLLLLFIGINIVAFRYGNSRQVSINAGVRAIMVIVPLFFFATFLRFNHTGTWQHRFLTSVGDDAMAFDAKVGAEHNGPFLQFFNAIDSGSIMAKPTGYSRKVVKEIVQKYGNYTNELNMRRNASLKGKTVIYVLSESLSNPTRVPSVTATKNPLKNIEALKDTSHSSGGLMMSSGYGGGTANMEYMALTSLSMGQFSDSVGMPYVRILSKQKHAESIISQFDQSVAIHPFAGNYYNRREAYHTLGVQQYYAPDSQRKIDLDPISGHQYASDENTYAEVLSKVADDRTEKSQFIQVATMQNHTPYEKSYTHTNLRVRSSKLSGSENNELQHYSEGISISDIATKEFLTKLDKLKRPVTVVFYGDHLPGLYPNSLLEQNEIAMHETDYFIWSNNTTQHVTKPNNPSVVSPNYFSSLMFESINAKVSPFYGMMTKIQHEIPASFISGGIDVLSSNQNQSKTISIYVDKSNNKIRQTKLSNTQIKLIHDYRIIQYDQSAGKNYARSLGFYKKQ